MKNLGKDTDDNPQKVIFGLKENIAGVLAYIGGFITGVIFFALERRNKFVKFHALQSILISLLFLFLHQSVYPLLNLFPLSPLFITSVSSSLSLLLAVIFPLVWIFLMVKAYGNKMYRLPILGEYADRYS